MAVNKKVCQNSSRAVHIIKGMIQPESARLSFYKSRASACRKDKVTIFELFFSCQRLHLHIILTEQFAPLCRKSAGVESFFASRDHRSIL